MKSLMVIAVLVIATRAEAQEWTFCAPEGGVCAFTGTMEVRYGANGLFVVRTLTGGTACTNAVFGDPIFGTAKTCAITHTSPVAATPRTVVIVDSTNTQLGPLWDYTLLVFVDGAQLRNWSPTDTTPQASRWIAMYVWQGGFQTGPRTTYYEQANCGGQPYMAQFAWFPKPDVDFGTGIASLPGTAEQVPARSKFQGTTCQAISPRPDGTWAPMNVGKLLTFDTAYLGFVPPFHAEVVQ